jgi:hypothetical protein
VHLLCPDFMRSKLVVAEEEEEEEDTATPDGVCACLFRTT